LGDFQTEALKLWRRRHPSRFMTAGARRQSLGWLRLLFSQEAMKEIQRLGIGFRGDQVSEVFDFKPGRVNLHAPDSPFALASRGVSGGA
jgi:hypothetical protein